jgi:hypothetical protein
MIRPAFYGGANFYGQVAEWLCVGGRNTAGSIPALVS